VFFCSMATCYKQDLNCGDDEERVIPTARRGQGVKEPVSAVKMRHPCKTLS
jgi:hypothetical protein